MKKLIAALGLFLAMSGPSYAQISPVASNQGGAASAYSGNLVNSSALANSVAPSIDMAQYHGSRISAQVIYSSANLSASYFLDGSKSTGNFTVVDYTKLSSASATDTIILTTTALNGAILTVNGTQLRNGQEWSTKATVALTANSLAIALKTISYLSVSSAPITGGANNGYSAIYTTATFGSAYNAYPVVSNTSSMTVATANLTGGRDNAVVTINGTQLKQGTAWSAVTSNAQTATNIAVAINASSALISAGVVGTGSAAIVYATSTLNGSSYNYALLSSTPTALLASGANMTGGTSPEFTLNSKLFSSTNTTGFGLGLAVLYSSAGSPAIGGLTNQTTYYAVPVSAFSFYLAKYSTSAIAGLSADYVTVTSTNSGLSSHTYSLTPLVWTSSASYTWQSSNDGTNYATVATTGTVTFSSGAAATDSLFDFGAYNYRYLRFNFTPPTTGAVIMQVPVYIKQDGIGAY